MKITFSLSLILIMTACVGSGNSSMNKVTTRVLLSSPNCGVMNEDASLSIISSGDEFLKGKPRLANLTRKMLGKNYNMVFEHELVMLINMGLRRTGGYSLALTDDVYISEDNWAIVGLRWNIPQKGAMLTQSLTSPCLLVAISKRKYEGIRILDQTKKVQLQVTL